MSFLKEIIFPKFCLGCGLVGKYLCQKCQKKLTPYQNKFCFNCQKLSYHGLTHNFCLKNFYIDGVFSLFVYSPLFKKIIKNIKYRLAKEIFYDFLSNCYKVILSDLGFYKKLFSQGEFLPIPLSQKRYNIRGFNQSQILGEFFSQIFNIPLANYLERIKETSFLAKIKEKKKRYLAIKGAFKLKKEINLLNKKIILVDDVLTTGATIKEASRVLKKNGVGEIYVFTLARG